MLFNPVTQPEFKMKHKEDKGHAHHHGEHAGHHVHPEHMRHHKHHMSEHHHGHSSNPLGFSHVGMAHAFGIRKPSHG